MAINQQKPSTKYTVGAQYICFNNGDANGDWDAGEFETDVIKLPTVVNVEVTDNTDSYDSYASGDIYESDSVVSTKDIQVEQLVFPEEVLARMRGDEVDEGVIMGGGLSTRPFFAYGIPIIKKDGTRDMRWYPKCKLQENTDRTATSTDSHADQTDTTTIRAYGFDEDQTKDIRILTSVSGYGNVTEDAFFAAPLTTKAAAKALKGETTNPTNP